MMMSTSKRRKQHITITNISGTDVKCTFAIILEFHLKAPVEPKR